MNATLTWAIFYLKYTNWLTTIIWPFIISRRCNNSPWFTQTERGEKKAIYLTFIHSTCYSFRVVQDLHKRGIHKPYKATKKCCSARSTKARILLIRLCIYSTYQDPLNERGPWLAEALKQRTWEESACYKNPMMGFNNTCLIKENTAT